MREGEGGRDEERASRSPTQDGKAGSTEGETRQEIQRVRGKPTEGERERENLEGRKIVVMEERRFNNVTMNERTSERALAPSRRLPDCATAEPRDRRLNCKITERGTMRARTTLCLHLNNPRARGYVIP